MDRQLQKEGYLDVKFPPRSRGLKVKPWKKRWVVVHQMSDLAARETVARLDIYADELSASAPRADKTTIILENITAVRRARSRTHPYAFEIVDDAIILILSGSNEADTQSWIILLRHILWPRESAPPDEAEEVSLIDNKDSHRLNLCGNYWLSVSPTAITLKDTVDCETKQTWKLSTLKKFYLATTPDDRDLNQILVIQAGPLAESGEGEYLLFSSRAKRILQMIMDCIGQALENRKAKENLAPGYHRQRTTSTTSTISSYKTLLDRQMSGALPEEYPSCPGDSRSPSPVEEPPMLFKSPHLLTARSASLPKNVTGFQRGGSFKPLKHVLEGQPRRQTFAELSTETLFETPVRSTRSMENFSKDDNLVKSDGNTQKSRVPKEIDDVRRDKTRTVSVSSNVSRTSGTSRDSGIMFNVDNKAAIDEESNKDNHVRDASNSFDSAVSTSEPSDHDFKPKETVMKEVSQREDEKEGIITDLLGLGIPKEDEGKTDTMDVIPEKKISVTSNIYAVIPSRKTSAVSNDYAAIPADLVGDVGRPKVTKVRRALSLGENDYEELDNFRKDLSKHLGFNPDVNSKDEPPALPERPRSIQVVRRQTKVPRKVRASKVASMFVKSSRKSSSSSSEEDEVNALISQVHNWPLQSQFSVTDDNDLYQAGAETVLYDEITASYERLDQDHTTAKDASDLLVPSPPFDLLSPPPLSCQLAWKNIDLLTASPTGSSQALDINSPSSSILVPTKDVVDFSWAGPSHSPSKEGSFLQDNASMRNYIFRLVGRRRSSTLSCPCPDERRSNFSFVQGDDSECSRSFPEVSDYLLRNKGKTTELKPEDPNPYECMSSPETPVNAEKISIDNWADFSAFEQNRAKDDRDDSWADFSVFGSPDLSSERDTTENKTAPDTTSRNPSSSTEIGDLIVWDLVENSSDKESTYIDMSLSGL